jgi:hypothetical protein
VESGERGELRLLSGESQTRIIGDEVSLRSSSSLMWWCATDPSSAIGEAEAGGVVAAEAAAVVPGEAVANLGKSKDSILLYNFI